MTIRSRVLGPFREYGFSAGFLYVVARLLQSVSPRLNLYVYELMVQPITDRPLLPARMAQGLEIHEIRPGSPEIDIMPARADIKESRFRQGALCLGCYKRGTLIGYLWLRFGEYDEDEVRCTYLLTPADQSVFDFDLYVLPEHRMGLGFAGIWNGVNKYLHERSIRFTFSRLTRFNLPSRRAHAHLGWRKTGSAVFIQAWGLEVMFATVRPYFHIGLGARNRVKLHLDAAVLGGDGPAAVNGVARGSKR